MNRIRMMAAIAAGLVALGAAGLAGAQFPLKLGASIACNGICLTVTSITPEQHFTVAASAETLRLTTAEQWRAGTRINLEPSLVVGDALGGHLVSGHVDGVGMHLFP